MGHDLVVEGGSLDDAAARIDALAAGLGRAVEDSAAIQRALGEAGQVRGLKEAVGGFESSWSVRRDGLRGTLVSLSGVLRQIEAGLDDADAALAEAATPSPVQHGRGWQVQ